MRKLLLILFVALSVCSSQGQNFPENTYRSTGNLLYWKNRAPIPGYWQQDVHYTIHAKIDDSNDIISGEEILQYWNNSPDTLDFLFFHLFQNAFQPGSYFDNLNRNNGTQSKFGKYESMRLGNVIERITIGEVDLEKEIDNTVMKVYLDKPLLPGGSVTVKIIFKTYYDSGGLRRRMKLIQAFGVKQYNGAQWYPKLAVYDRKMGWDTDQHLNHEFYGDFGTFDVSLDFPAHYIVEATGDLVNREEVLPDSLRKKLDLSNFKDKKWDSKPGPKIITPEPGKRKEWRFHAENVHDFAFVANPLFRLGEVEWNGKKAIAVVQEPHASGWQNAASYTAKILEVFSRDFGMYEYPKMIVADAQDGMEYPMLTMDGGKDPGYRGLLVHEVGHNWFYGMIGNNETYRAFLDEGFTQFLTAWGLEKIDGPYGVSEPIKNKYVKHFTDTFDVWERNVYWGYLRDAVRGEDMPINTHSDDFNGSVGHGGGYRHVYSKTATMLKNLEYVLGDTLFSNAIKYYFNQWKFCHPYPEDFRNSVIQYTKTDLNWFFDQWIETKKVVDYGITSVKKGSLSNQYKIQFTRFGESQMPIEFSVQEKNGTTKNYLIPNNWFQKKETQNISLPRWIGWGKKLNPKYEAIVYTNSKLTNVIIDPSGRLTDINMLDNQLKFPVRFAFDSKIYSFPNRKKYNLLLGPDLWYNAFDGVKLGVKLSGNYLNYKHIFFVSVWYNTGLGQWKSIRENPSIKRKYFPVSVNTEYKNNLDRVIPGPSWGFGYRYLDGLERMYVNISKRWEEKRVNTYLQFNYLYRIRNPYDVEYLIYRDEWNAAKYNLTFNLGTQWNYNAKKVSGSVDAKLRSSMINTDYDYHTLSFQWKNQANLWRLVLKTRVFMQAGSGSNPAPESMLFFAGANPEEMMENKFMRSRGFFPSNWAQNYGSQIGHLHYGGGLNLRGYNSYYMVDVDKYGNRVVTYKGLSGAAINAELELDKIINWKPKKISDWIIYRLIN